MGKLVVQKTLKRSATTTKPTAERGNPLTRLWKFLREVKVELTKVSWPNRQEIITSTIVVLAAMTFFALYIGGIDQIFVKLIQLLSRTLG